MALWAKTTQLPPELLTIAESLYEKYFTTSVRSTIGVWLEKYMMDDVDADNPINENYVNNIMKSFKKELERHNELIDTNPQLIIELNGSTDEVIALFKAIRECLREESRLVDRYHDFNALTSNYESRLSRGQDKDLYFSYMIIISVIKSLDTLLYRFVAEIKSMNDFYQRSVESMDSRLLEAIPKYNQNKADNVTKLYSHIALTLHEVTFEINRFGSTLLNDKLIKWKIDHQKAANSGVPSYSIDTLQEYFAWIEDAIAQTDTRISTANCHADEVAIVSSHFRQILDEFRQHNQMVLETLLANSVVMELEPRQVISSLDRTRFQVSLRLLMVSCLKRWHVTATAYCLSEQHMGVLNEAIEKYYVGTRSLVRDSERCARLIFDEVRPEAMRDRHCKLPISEQKFCLIFNVTFIKDDKRQLRTRVTSLPMVFVSNRSSDILAAWSTITWHNAFLTPEYNFLAESKEVPWLEVAAALASKFKGATGIQLKPSHLQYLGKMFFTNKHVELNSSVDYHRLCKDVLPFKKFTFWHWFYETIKLTRDFLTSAWKSGLVTGFASTENTMATIARWKSAPFMIRLADTHLASIEVVFVDDQMQYYGLLLKRKNFFKMGIKNNADFVGDIRRLCKTRKADWVDSEISSEEFLEIVDSPILRPEENSVSTELKKSSIDSQQDIHLPLGSIEENSESTKSRRYSTERPIKQSDSTFDIYGENSRSIESRSPTESLEGIDILDLLFGESEKYFESISESGENYTEIQELDTLFNTSEQNLKIFKSTKRPTTELQLELHPPFKKHKKNSESNYKSFTSKHMNDEEENQQFLEATMETSNNSLDLIDELCSLSDLF